ncbi:MAG: helix-turn-helix transcriptional regulator [Kiritimatiellae bacterium]|nr:helix-turn-helix transcriptional regulator [Kiritimatiellia bacterium]
MFGENLKVLRKARSLTQEELGERIGVTKQTVSNWESGNITPALDVFLKLVDFFHTTPNELLGYNDHEMIDVGGLSKMEIEHLQMIIGDLKSHHNI